jgi:hypothetical protein
MTFQEQLQAAQLKKAGGNAQAPAPAKPMTMQEQLQAAQLKPAGGNAPAPAKPMTMAE